MFDGGYEEEEEITSTPFRVTVSHSEPFCFGQYATQDVNSSVRLTHLVYTPPATAEAFESYYKAHPKAARPPLGGSTVSIAAKVRTLLIDGKLGSFVIACFPLDTDRVKSLEGDRSALETVPAPTAPGAALPATTHIQRFNDLFDVVVPMPTDIVSKLDIHLDVDGSVELLVEGPGEVTFVGEQYSALIPEWMNHKMFRIGAGDEELPEDEEDDDLSEDEMAEMYRLAR